MRYENVGIGVYRDVDLGGGYRLLYISYEGYPSGYKMIVHNDKLIAIVSRRYNVLLNEDLEEMLKEAGFKIVNITREPANGEYIRRAYFIVEYNGVKYHVVNSIDGSLALRIYPTYGGIPLITSGLKPFYMRHSRKELLSGNELSSLVEAYERARELFRHVFLLLEDMDADTVADIYRIAVENGFPERWLNQTEIKYVSGFNAVKQYGDLVGKILNSTLSINTKLRYIRILNDALLTVASAWASGRTPAQISKKKVDRDDGDELVIL